MLATTLPLLLLLAGTLVFWQVRLSILGGPFSVFVCGDLYWYFLPAYAYQARRLAEGSIPLWNPYQATGQPFLATLQPGALYPARLLLLAFEPARAMAVSLLAHFVLLVSATYALGRTLGGTRLAAAAAAVVLAATFGANQFYWPSYFEAGAWWPVLALALARVAGGGGWGWVVLLGLSGAMPVLAGGYQVPLYMGYALAVFALGLLLDRRWRRASPDALALRLGVAALIALASASPQLLPTLAWSRETARQAAALTDAQLNPFGWLQTPLDVAHQLVERRPGFQPWFVSAAVLVVAAVGFASQRALGALLGGGGLLLGLIALGPGTLVFPLYRLLPGLAMYRFPLRLFTAVFFLLTIGVVFGVSTFQRWRPAGRSLVGPALAAMAAIAMLDQLLMPLRNPTQLPWLQPATALQPGSLARMTARRAGAGRVAMLGSPGQMQPRDAMLLGFRSVQDYEPLASGRLRNYLYAVAGEAVPGHDALQPFLGTVQPRNSLARPRLLDLVATTVVTVTAPVQPPMHLDGYEQVTRRGGTSVYHNPMALPRAYLVARARFVATEDEALAAIQEPGFDPRGEAVLVGRALDSRERRLAEASPGRFAAARITRDDPEHVAVEVDVAEPAVLVLADAFAPGWSVEVDGSAARLRQANYLVRGVVVSPGDRRVTMRYDAPGWRLGWLACAAGWLCAAAVVVVSRRRQRRPAAR